MKTFREHMKEGFEDWVAPWLKDVDISNATIGIKNDKIVWYDGRWEDGTWEDGSWKDGTWKGGTWEGGTWLNGTWKNGTWINGTWKDKKNLRPDKR